MTSTSSKTDPAPAPDRVLVGLLVRPHGVRGEAMVELHTERPERFTAGRELWLSPRRGESRRVRVAASRPHRQGLLVAFEGIADRDAVEALRGAELEIDRAEVGAPPAGRWWAFDLVGCRASDRLAGDLGEVVDLVEDGGGWLVLVARPSGATLALPFVEAYLVEVDVGAKRLAWNLPEGLIELCESRS